jgi:hypothetical protein
MVKQRYHKSSQSLNNKGFIKNSAKPRKINASTPYETCSEQLSPFGGLLALIKFLDLVEFKHIFSLRYQPPTRKPKLGHYRMMIGILMLLFIGFNRIWHFTYIRLDAMLCGFFRLTRLPVASTFWRYVDSLGINQANAIVNVMAVLRERVWQLADLRYFKIRVNIDTTANTLFGHQQGGRKGYNPKHRGKPGYRPILCFIEETREYLLGKLRKGETLSGEQAAAFISKIQTYLPGCVRQVLLRADGELCSWEAVNAAQTAGFDFIFANKRCKPHFNPDTWYQPKKREPIQYNSCTYTPMGWEKACRFVAMRIPKDRETIVGQLIQPSLFEDDRYSYRIFCTSLGDPAHHVISQYDKRADVENLVGEAKREGLDAIPSAKFKNNYAFFQIVMLAYNIWRYLKLFAHNSVSDTTDDISLQGVVSNTIRIARLRLLFIAAKLVRDSNRDKVKYSIHDARTPAVINFLGHLDKARSKVKPWLVPNSWPQRFSLQM